jgi:MFS family permease
MMTMNTFRLVRPTLISFALLGAFWGSFAAVVPVLKRQMDVNDATFGFAMLLAAFGSVIAMWIAPWADAKLGRFSIFVGCFGLMVAFLAPGFAHDWVLFACAMMVCSSFSGSLDVVMNAQVSQTEALSSRPLMSAHHALFSFSYAGFAFIAGLLREAHFAPWVPFAVVAGLGLAVSPWMIRRVIQDPDTSQPTKGMGVPVLFVVLAGFIIMVAFIAEQASEAWSALHLERTMGAGAAMGAMGPTILGLTMGIGRVYGQILTHRFGEMTTVRIASLFAALGAIAAGASVNLTLTYIGFAVLGMGISVVVPLIFALAGQAVSPRKRTLVISRVALVGYVGFFIGPAMMGGVAQLFSLGTSFVLMGFLLAVVGGLMPPLLARYSHS